MSYEPLHHKYRPQTFANLVGQEAIAQTLTNAILSERIAPAYLFTGPRGTGKTSSARILAKSLNCLASEKPTPKPCGICEICRTIARGSALDVTEIDAASNTGVDNIREIIERAQFAPVQCRYKVYVVDECHMLSSAAFNALLKTLEEPPKHVVFVLATTDPQRVLPTIISRCQRFDFRRIPLEAMVQHLQDIAVQEAIAITPDAVTLVAQVAQGGLRDAESLLDQLSLLAGEITVESVWDLVGAVPERDLLELTKAIASDDSETVLDQCRKLMDRGREPLVVLQNLAGFYRDLLIAKTAPNRHDLVALTPPTWKQVGELAQLWEVSRILHGQQHLKNSEAQLKNTTQPRLWLEVTLLGLLPSASSPLRGEIGLTASQPPPRTSPPPSPHSPKAEEPSQLHSSHPRMGNSTNGIASNSRQAIPSEPVHHQPPDKAATISPGTGREAAGGKVDVQTTELEQVWQQILNHIQLFGTKQLLRQHCCLLDFNGQQAIVGITSKNLLKLAQGKIADIEAAFKAVYQSPVKVSLKPKVSDSTNTTTNVREVEEISSAEPKGRVESKPQNPLTEITPPVITKPMPTREQPQVVAETSNGNPPKTVMYPPTPVLTDEANGDVNQIEAALGNLKKFFEGEIIELTDELSPPEVIVSSPISLAEPGIDGVIDSYQAELEANEKKLDLTVPAITHEQPLSEINAEDELLLRRRQEQLQFDDDGDLAF